MKDLIVKQEGVPTGATYQLRPGTLIQAMSPRSAWVELIVDECSSEEDLNAALLERLRRAQESNHEG